MSASRGRVVVTGAAGLIGSAVCARLIASGAHVTALDLEEPRVGAERSAAVDATDHDALARELEGADALIHLAAIPHPSLGTPFEVYRNNTVATFAALAAAGESGVPRIVVASSINASGVPFNRPRRMPAYFPMDEELPEEIDDAYSLSKRTGELAATMAARRWGVGVVSLRFPLVKTAETLREVAVQDAADPDSRVREGWSYLEVGDAADAVAASLDAPISGAVVLGLAAEDTLLDRPTEEALDEFAHGVPRHRPMPGFASGVDASRARELIGFVPRFSLRGADLAEEATR